MLMRGRSACAVRACEHQGRVRPGLCLWFAAGFRVHPSVHTREHPSRSGVHTVYPRITILSRDIPEYGPISQDSPATCHSRARWKSLELRLCTRQPTNGAEAGSWASLWPLAAKRPSAPTRSTRTCRPRRAPNSAP
eukprot:867506-Prymnesium_polylepis.1